MGSLPRFNSKFIVIAVSVILLLYFVVFPMGILLYDSIMVNGAINFGNYADVYSQDVNWRALSNTVQLSLLVLRSRWPGLLAAPICPVKKHTGLYWLPAI